MHARTSTFAVLARALALAPALAPAPALALAPARADARPSVEIGVHGGYAREIQPSVRGDLGPYGAGFGARAGALFGRLYVGVWATGFLGTRQEAVGVGSSYEASYAASLVGPEIGWDLRFGERFTLRPLLGGGVRRWSGHTVANGQRIDDVSNDPYLMVGALGAWRFDRFFAGPELRMLLVPLDLPGAWTPSLTGVVGATF